MQDLERLNQLTEKMQALLSASLRGTALSTDGQGPRVQSLDFLIRGFAVELTSETLRNQLEAIDQDLIALKRKTDSMSEMGEMESLRLQMAMDRLSKMMSTLSNTMKKISTTAESITQNLK